MYVGEVMKEGGGDVETKRTCKMKNARVDQSTPLGRRVSD